MALLELSQLHTCFKTSGGLVQAVNDVSFSVEAGQTLGLAGESGCGKSVCALSILRLLDDNGFISGGEIRFDGRDLAALSAQELLGIRGNEIAMIFQEPMTSLNPVFTVQRQLREVLVLHQQMSRRDANARVTEMLRAVRISNPEDAARQYPHQLSGGMRQRVMIAMALCCQPKLLIADEPTTALDVTIGAQILTLIDDLKRAHGTSVLFITHDLGVIRRMCDEVAIMYCGQIVERAKVCIIFGDGAFSHPYTEGLLRAVPRLDMPAHERLQTIDGAVPHPLHLPAGCKFEPRCKYRAEKCSAAQPELVQVGDKHWIRCFYPERGGKR